MKDLHAQIFAGRPLWEKLCIACILLVGIAAYFVWSALYLAWEKIRGMKL